MLVTPGEHLERTALELEWPRLVEQITAHCQSLAGAEALASLRPEPSLDAARARMQRTREAMLLDALEPMPGARLEDSGEASQRLSHGAALDGPELHAIGALLLHAAALRAYLTRHREAAPALAARLQIAPALAPLAELVQTSLAPDGTVQDSASKELRRARQRAREERQALRERLAALLDRHGEAMQGSFVAERDGRYVLPVRADAPFRVEGLVLGSSASGGTLYVEPRETHELGNSVQLRDAEVRAEEARVLEQLNRALAEERDAIAGARQACIEADCARAIARYARSTRSLAIEPGAEPELDIRGMRHPLLVARGGEVAPTDLRLRAGEALIISGPNAGGKTVALKSLGLAAWMVRCGLPIPADEGSRVGWFEPVLSVIGDNQSLVHSLSTFSAHIVLVSASVAAARRGTLVLIDELAAGTDPEEGAALACAIVIELVERGAALCVTTHHERLEALAANHPRLHNASVGFDRARLAPTFRLEYGAPGASSALLIAERYGLSPELVQRAEAFLSEATVDRRALTRELDEQRARWQAAAAEAEHERRQAAVLREQLEQERRRAAKEERGRLTREAQSVLDEVRDARQRLRAAEARLEAGEAAASALRDAQRALNETAQFVSIGGKLHRAVNAAEPSPEPPAAGVRWEALTPGTRVTLKHLGTSGVVVSKPRPGQVIVQVGAMKTSVDIDALGPAAAGARDTKPTPERPSRGKQRQKGASEAGSTIAAAPLRSPTNTLSLVGQRVEPALEQLDGFIDRLLRSGESAGFVVHGHGTGALRSAVREHLRGHRYVSRSEPASPDDGGDALTVFWLA